MSSTSISHKTMLKNWLSALTRDKNVESLQEKLQPYFDKTFDQDNQQISPINPPTWLSSASDIQSYNGPTTSGMFTMANYLFSRSSQLKCTSWYFN